MTISDGRASTVIPIDLATIIRDARTTTTISDTPTGTTTRDKPSSTTIPAGRTSNTNAAVPARARGMGVVVMAVVIPAVVMV